SGSSASRSRTAVRAGTSRTGTIRPSAPPRTGAPVFGVTTAGRGTAPVNSTWAAGGGAGVDEKRVEPAGGVEDARHRVVHPRPELDDAHPHNAPDPSPQGGRITDAGTLSFAARRRPSGRRRRRGRARRQG